jgi:hypothetical protein
MAEALGVKIEDILDVEAKVPRKSGPTGRLRKVFDEVASLPRRQQKKVMEFVEAFVNQQKTSN